MWRFDFVKQGDIATAKPDETSRRKALSFRRAEVEHGGHWCGRRGIDPQETKSAGLDQAMERVWRRGHRAPDVRGAEDGSVVRYKAGAQCNELESKTGFPAPRHAHDQEPSTIHADSRRVDDASGFLEP